MRGGGAARKRPASAGAKGEPRKKPAPATAAAQPETAEGGAAMKRPASAGAKGKPRKSPAPATAAAQPETVEAAQVQPEPAEAGAMQPEPAEAAAAQPELIEEAVPGPTPDGAKFKFESGGPRLPRGQMCFASPTRALGASAAHPEPSAHPSPAFQKLLVGAHNLPAATRNLLQQVAERLVRSRCASQWAAHLSEKAGQWWAIGSALEGNGRQIPKAIADQWARSY